MRVKTRFTQVYQRSEESFSYRAYDRFGRAFERGGYRTATEARDARLEALAKIKQGTFSRDNRKLAEVIEEYCEYKSRLRPTSHEAIVSALKHVSKIMGGVRLDRVRVQDIETMLQEVAEKTSEKRANAVYKHLNGLIKWAIPRGYLGSNPAAAVEAYTVEQRKPRILTDDEALRLLDAGLPRERTIIAIALYAGLRRSEIMGLNWEDVDLVGKVIHVNKQYLRGKLVKPKTRAAERSISITPPLMPILREYRDLLFPESIQQGPVFTTFKGDRLRSEHWSDGVFGRIALSAGLEDLHFHDLRSNFATRAAASGTPPGILAKTLGHSSFEVTYKKYYAPTIEDKAEGLAGFREYGSGAVARRA